MVKPVLSQIDSCLPTMDSIVDEAKKNSNTDTDSNWSTENKIKSLCDFTFCDGFKV
jgi:hypothetical protein